MIGSAPMRLISIGLKVFLAALASAIGIYFIWIGITGDPIVIGLESRSRKSAQDDKWSFCLMAGTLWPANQERP
jgi:hypothetical protein